MVINKTKQNYIFVGFLQIIIFYKTVNGVQSHDNVRNVTKSNCSRSRDMTRKVR